MQKRTDQSYGAILFSRKGSDLYVLLIKQKTRSGDSFWTFPKGHPEEGETPEESALREVQEETGVSSCTLLKVPPISFSYEFVWDAFNIDKTVTYFIGVSSSMETFISQPHEIEEILWCAIDDVSAKLTHDNARALWEGVNTKDLLDLVRSSLT